jgi:hypothetical protein
MKAHKLSGDIMREDTRLALLEQALASINITMGRLEGKMDRLENKMDDGFSTLNNRINKMEDRIDRFDSKMDSGFQQINSRIWSNFYWGVGGFSGVLGLLAHALRWI